MQVRWLVGNSKIILSGLRHAMCSCLLEQGSLQSWEATVWCVAVDTSTTLLHFNLNFFSSTKLCLGGLFSDVMQTMDWHFWHPTFGSIVSVLSFKTVIMRAMSTPMHSSGVLLLYSGLWLDLLGALLYASQQPVNYTPFKPTHMHACTVTTKILKVCRCDACLWLLSR